MGKLKTYVRGHPLIRLKITGLSLQWFNGLAVGSVVQCKGGKSAGGAPPHDYDLHMCLEPDQWKISYLHVEFCSAAVVSDTIHVMYTVTLYQNGKLNPCPASYSNMPFESYGLPNHCLVYCCNAILRRCSLFRYSRIDTSHSR